MTFRFAEGFLSFLLKGFVCRRLALGDCYTDSSLLAATYTAFAQRFLSKVSATQGSASTLSNERALLATRNKVLSLPYPFLILTTY